MLHPLWCTARQPSCPTTGIPIYYIITILILSFLILISISHRGHRVDARSGARLWSDGQHRPMAILFFIIFNFIFYSHGDRRAPLVDDQHTYMLHHHHFDFYYFSILISFPIGNTVGMHGAPPACGQMTGITRCRF